MLLFSFKTVFIFHYPNLFGRIFSNECKFFFFLVYVTYFPHCYMLSHVFLIALLSERITPYSAVFLSERYIGLRSVLIWSLFFDCCQWDGIKIILYWSHTVKNFNCFSSLLTFVFLKFISKMAIFSDAFWTGNITACTQKLLFSCHSNSCHFCFVLSGHSMFAV